MLADGPQTTITYGNVVWDAGEWIPGDKKRVNKLYAREGKKERRKEGKKDGRKEGWMDGWMETRERLGR